MAHSAPRSLNGSDWPLRGRWRLCVDAHEDRHALLCCPNCGSVASLDDHTISANGEVEPQVSCRQCDFTDAVRLEMYTPEVGR